jgi:hypothetical protein
VKLQKQDIETVRDPDRRRLLKIGSVSALVAITTVSQWSRTAQAKHSNNHAFSDEDTADDKDVQDGVPPPKDPADISTEDDGGY